MASGLVAIPRRPCWRFLARKRRPAVPDSLHLFMRPMARMVVSPILWMCLLVPLVACGMCESPRIPVLLTLLRTALGIIRGMPLLGIMRGMPLLLMLMLRM